jgi:hypothetical protein
MRSKLLSSPPRNIEGGIHAASPGWRPVCAQLRVGRQLIRKANPFFLTATFFCLAQVTCPLHAQTNSAPIFLGESSCSSSSCHGGAGEKRDQCLVWSKRDYHSRSYATLTTARSARIADSLKISEPTQSARCTACHAPFLSVPVRELSKSIDPTLGVSCESCHGRAENWLRSHTRTDFTHQDRIHAGMRDLENLYVRANSCVACHQNVDADVLQAGHPELIFELDGQAVTEPKHWREKGDWSGPRTWLVGQTVALREMSWQLSRESAPTENAVNRWSAMIWLLQAVGTMNGVLPADPTVTLDPAVSNVERAQKWADELARTAATMPWPAESTSQCLSNLANTSGNFREKTASRAAQGRRAERLVLALDRVETGLNDVQSAKRLEAPLNQLFKDAQSLPDFDPNQFAAHLEEFQKALVVQ